jgi:hypothetical protein
MNWLGDRGSLAKGRVRNRAGAQSSGDTTDGGIASKITRECEAVLSIVAFGDRPKFNRGTVPESINCLIRIGNDGNDDAPIS